VVVKDARADYSFSPFGELGDTHRLSLAYAFGPGAAAAAVPTGPTPTAVPTPAATAAVSPPSPTAVPAAPGGAAAPSSDVFVPAMDALALPTATPRPGPPSAPTPETGEKGAPEALTLEFELPQDAVTRGLRLEKEGKVEEAFSAYLGAVQKDRNDARAWAALGRLYHRLGRKEHAVRCFEEVLRIRPEKQDLRDWLERYKAKP
jgi:tetratricopeptide (TPR) repeat protein